MTTKKMQSHAPTPMTKEDYNSSVFRQWHEFYGEKNGGLQLNPKKLSLMLVCHQYAKKKVDEEEMTERLSNLIAARRSLGYGGD